MRLNQQLRHRSNTLKFNNNSLEICDGLSGFYFIMRSLVNMAGFNDLPEEIQSLLIRDNLSLPDAMSLSAVSRRIHRLLNDKSYWRDRLKTNFPHIFITITSSDSNIDYKEIFKKNYKAEYVDLTKEQRDLFCFVKDGDIKRLQGRGITKKNLQSVRDKNGLSLLDWAKKNNHQPVLNHFFDLILKELNPVPVTDINKANELGHCLLHWAVLCNKLSKELNQIQVIDLNKADELGHYLLHWAVLCNKLSYVETLLFSEANTKVALSSMRYQPLHLAAQAGQLDIAKAIVENDPSTLDEKDALGQTALLWASANGHTDIVEYLLEKNPDLEAASNPPDHKNHAKTSLYWAVERGHTAVVEKLMTKRPNTKVALSNMRYQPLHLAAQAGQLDIIKAIVENDPSTLDEKDAFGQTALLWASTSGHADVVEYLFNQGAADLKAGILKSSNEDINLEKLKMLNELALKIISTPKNSDNEQRNNLLVLLQEEAKKAYQKSNDNIDQKFTKLQTMFDKFKKLNEFTEKLNEISLQAKSLEDRGHTVAAQSAKTLVTNLEDNAKTYLADFQPTAYKAFKSNCSKHIKTAKPILEIHRGWKRLLSNIALAILGIGVGYLAAVCLNKAVTGNFLFFNKTRSQEKLCALSQTITKIKAPADGKIQNRAVFHAK